MDGLGPQTTRQRLALGVASRRNTCAERGELTVQQKRAPRTEPKSYPAAASFRREGGPTSTAHKNLHTGPSVSRSLGTSASMESTDRQAVEHVRLGEQLCEEPEGCRRCPAHTPPVSDCSSQWAQKVKKQKETFTKLETWGSEASREHESSVDERQSGMERRAADTSTSKARQRKHSERPRDGVSDSHEACAL